jgi:hypothetical protein
MELTINISPELAASLRDEAERRGLDPSDYIVTTLEERIVRTNHNLLKLKFDEADLLRKINEGVDTNTWQRYHELVAKRRAETLTEDEQRELIAYSDRIEEANARRMECLATLADLRRTTLDALRRELGITPPSYD